MNQTIAHRLWAAAALVIAIATISFAIDVTLSRIPKGFTVVACVVLAVIVAAYGLMRRGPTRIVALAAAVLLLAGSIVLVFVEHDPTDDVLVAVGVVAVLAAARRAFRVRFEWPRARRPERPVLFFNPLSGGGKAARFDLAGQALRRGIEPIELRRGDDLEQLVRDAVSRGADALAMAGGDGSQAIVAMVAAELDLPYACIPSGTRNHFALDLGVDRDDVVGALDAFVDGRERRVDLAEVNDRVFVNNVSLGLYADAVERPGYREAKLRTLLDTIPEALGPSAAAPSLFWDGDAGAQSAVAVLVSNNPYRLGRAIGSGTRPRLNGGLLGIAALAPTRHAGDGGVRHRLGMRQWTDVAFEMQADQRVPAGIDGEAVELEPPLRFRSRCGALRVRIAPTHPGVSPSALEPDKPWGLLQALAHVAFRGACQRAGGPKPPSRPATMRAPPPNSRISAHPDRVSMSEEPRQARSADSGSERGASGSTRGVSAMSARGTAVADRARHWVARQDATTRPGVVFEWWRRYRSIDGPLQSLLLTSYVFLAVLPATLVLVEYVQRNPAALANELVHGYGLTGSAAGLLRGVLVGDRRHEFGSALLAIATALFFGLGFGRVLQLVHARAWQIEVEPKPMDQLRYAAVLVVLFGLLLLVLLEEKLFSGWSAWLDAAFVPGWIALLVGYFVWAPRMLTHKRLPGRDLLPGAVLTAFGLVALMFLSSVAMASWVDLYAADFAGLGVVMALFFWLALSSTVIVAAASLSPSLAERRESLRPRS